MIIIVNCRVGTRVMGPRVPTIACKANATQNQLFGSITRGQQTLEGVMGLPAHVSEETHNSGRHGRTEETHTHYNGVCLSDYLACA